MIYGYARCSTNEKLQDINRQVRELKQQGATDTTIYLEYESGGKVTSVLIRTDSYAPQKRVVLKGTKETATDYGGGEKQ